MSVVKLIANTAIRSMAMEGVGYAPQSGLSADELAEFAGRNCYRSFDRPNPATASNQDYMAHILEVGHESVLEHASATFYIEASRSVLAEITRHRHLSFSVVSQRYVDAATLGVHVPPALELLPVESISGAVSTLGRARGAALVAYGELLEIFSDAGLPRKQACEAARAVLPNMTNSPMVVTGNHRAWRDVLKKRWHVAADAEIREVAGMVLKELRTIAPNTYQDIPEKPYAYES